MKKNIEPPNIQINPKGDASETKGVTDIYNSEPEIKPAEAGQKIFRHLKIPFIASIALISIFITFKLMFTPKDKKTGQNDSNMVKNSETMPVKEKFSPSMFAVEKTKKYINRNGFSSKFDKETGSIRRNIKFYTKKGDSSKPALPGNTYAAAKRPNISGKMIVFIKQSYGRKILEEEKGERGVLIKTQTPKTNRKTYNITQARQIAIPQGAVVDAYTRYKIFSYDTDVPVIAILLSNYYHNGILILKRGDEFFGTVNARHSLDRLNMHFERIIKRSGKNINIDAIAMMPDGSGGVRGNERHNYGKNILVSIASGIAGAAAIFAGGGSALESSNPYSFQNQVRENVARNEIGDAQNGLNGYAASGNNEAITLPSHTPIKIIFLKTVY